MRTWIITESVNSAKIASLFAFLIIHVTAHWVLRKCATVTCNVLFGIITQPLQLRVERYLIALHEISSLSSLLQRRFQVLNKILNYFTLPKISSRENGKLIFLIARLVMYLN